MDVAQNRAAMQQVYGGTILWTGGETRTWGVENVRTLARQAHALGFDTICVKRADGGIRWYSSPAQLAEEAAAAAAEGCGYLPFSYCYGPKFAHMGEAFPGEQQVRDECAILIEMARAVPCTSSQADMEVEWNGAVHCAALFCDLMRAATDITLSVSTWADPALQDWEGVAAALAPCVNAWVVQRYTDWLSHQPLPAEETCVMPGVDLSQEFGQNHPAAIAAGHPSVFVWYEAFAFMNEYRSEVLAITGRAGRAAHEAPAPAPAPAPTPAPTPAPAPAPAASPEHYTVVRGDTLSSIAARFYGHADLWPTIYNANRVLIGGNPNVIFPDEVLTIPPTSETTTVAQISGPARG